jgi:glycosyltransferase involved in cell wall biosynthesis
MTDMRPIRILHFVRRMKRGGIETWLMHVLRHIDRERFQMDFMVHTARPHVLDKEVRALGSKVIPCLHPGRPWTFARNFRRVLREHGPYDVVHSHVHYYSGWVLRLAREQSVPVRIAHSHSDTSRDGATAGFLRRRYLATMKRWITRHATLGLAASRPAAASLFGPDWKADPRWRVLYCGVDLAPFGAEVDRAAVRAELGIPADAFVLGHVGRFMEPKNHVFLVDIAAEVARREPNMRLLLVGDGSLEPAIRRRAAEVGLEERVVFAGSRGDVPRLMLGGMDAFVFPSLYEGLGLVLVEAQAAGLPCVLSDVVPEEADLVGPLVERVALAEPASRWANAVLRARDAGAAVSRSEALAAVRRGPLNLETSLRELESLYVEATQRRNAA